MNKQKKGFFSLPSLKNVFAAAVCTLAGMVVLGNSENVLHTVTEAEQSDKPLVERDIISVKRESVGSLILPEYYKMVSGDYIVKHGVVPLYADIGVRNLVTGNVTVSFDSDDALNKAIKSFEKQMIVELNANPEMIELKSKQTWTDSDYDKYCQLIGETFHVLDDIEGLKRDYSVNGTDYGRFQFPPTRSMNRISNDITNKTKTQEIDCEQRGVLMITLLERVSDSVLLGTAHEKPKFFYSTIDAFDGARNHVRVLAVSPTTQIITGAFETTSHDIFYEQALNTPSLLSFINGTPIINPEYDTSGFNQTEEQKSSSVRSFISHSRNSDPKPNFN
jgi:hypothetical protein